MISILMSRNFDFGVLLTYLLSSLAVIFFALPVHEFAHGFAANKLGDPTPRYQGRLSLNPLVHIDYLGALFLLLFGYGWAKPVQVNPRNFRNYKRDMAITAFAGPFSNLCFAFVALLLRQILWVIPAVRMSVAYNYLSSFLYFMAEINVSLFVFNLIPIPPFDGSRILPMFLSNRTYYKMMQYQRQLYFLLLILLATGVLSYPLAYVSNRILIALLNLVSLPFRFF